MASYSVEKWKKVCKNSCFFYTLSRRTNWESIQQQGNKFSIRFNWRKFYVPFIKIRSSQVIQADSWSYTWATPLEEKIVMVVYLSVVVSTLSNRKSIKPKAFRKISEHVFIELNNLSRWSTRIEGLNLKESFQIEKGIGVQLHFDNGIEFPPDFA